MEVVELAAKPPPPEKIWEGTLLWREPGAFARVGVSREGAAWTLHARPAPTWPTVMLEENVDPARFVAVGDFAQRAGERERESAAQSAQPHIPKHPQNHRSYNID